MKDLLLVLSLPLSPRRSELKGYEEERRLTKFEEKEERMRNEEKTPVIIKVLSGVSSEEAGAVLS